MTKNVTETLQTLNFDNEHSSLHVTIARKQLIHASSYEQTYIYQLLLANCYLSGNGYFFSKKKEKENAHQFISCFHYMLLWSNEC